MSLTTLTGQPEGWYLCDCTKNNTTRAYFWSGSELRGYQNGHFLVEARNHTNFRRLIVAPEPPPDVKPEERIVVAGTAVRFVSASDGWHILSGDGHQYLRKDGTFGLFDSPWDIWPTEAAAREFARGLSGQPAAE